MGGDPKNKKKSQQDDGWVLDIPSTPKVDLSAGNTPSNDGWVLDIQGTPIDNSKKKVTTEPLPTPSNNTVSNVGGGVSPSLSQLGGENNGLLTAGGNIQRPVSKINGEDNSFAPDVNHEHLERKFIGRRPTAQGDVVESVYETDMPLDLHPRVEHPHPQKKIIAPEGKWQIPESETSNIKNSDINPSTGDISQPLQSNFEQQQQAQKNTNTAIDNTLKNKINKLKSIGVNVTKEQEDFYRNNFVSRHANGDLQVDKDNKGNLVLKHGTGFIDSWMNAYNDATKKRLEDNYFNSLSNEDKMNYAERKLRNPDIYNPESDEAPSGILGAVGKFGGENIDMVQKGVITGMAMTAAFPEAAAAGALTSQFGGFLGLANDFTQSGYRNNYERTYNALRKQGIPQQDAANSADNAGTIGGLTQLATGAVLSTGLGELNGVTLPEPVAKGATEALFHAAGKVLGKDAPKMALASATGSLIEGGARLAAGTGEKPSDVLKEAGESLASGYGTGLAFGAPHLIAAALTAIANPNSVPSFARPQLENVLASLPSETMQAITKKAEEQGIASPGFAETADEKIDAFKEAKKPLETLPISEEKKAAIAGKTLQLEKLQEQKKTLEKIGVTTGVEDLEKQIVAMQGDIDKMYNAKDVFTHESDSLTGEKATDEPQGASIPEVVTINGNEHNPKDLLAGQEKGIIDAMRENVGLSETDAKNQINNHIIFLSKIIENGIRDGLSKDEIISKINKYIEYNTYDKKDVLKYVRNNFFDGVRTFAELRNDGKVDFTLQDLQNHYNTKSNESQIITPQRDESANTGNEQESADEKIVADKTVAENGEVAEGNKGNTQEEVKPIRQLGNGANVYFETKKYRVNDDSNGKVLLNVGNANDETPLAHIEFDNANEAVFVAKKLEENVPEGLVSDYHNVDKIIENYKKEFKDENSNANIGELSSGGKTDTSEPATNEPKNNSSNNVQPKSEGGKLAAFKQKKLNLHNDEPVIAEHATEKELAERNLAERDNVKQEPAITGIESTAENKAGTPSEKLAEAEKQATGIIDAATKVVNVPVADISTNELEYQGRKNKFSERSANKVAENFDANEFDPIVLYKHPDGKTYVLSGHSRLEGMKRRGVKTIPARYFEGTDKYPNTPEGARDFALNSNKLASLQTDLENAAYYREKIKAGSSYDAVLKEAKENEQEGSAKKIVSLAHLNPNGKAIQALEAFDKGEGDTKTNALIVAQKIGDIRAKNEHLTDAHENEMFDYFTSDKDNIPTDKEINDPNNPINRSINAAKFEPNEPLNLESKVVKSQNRIDWENRKKELEKQQSDLKQQVNPSKKTGWTGLKEKAINSLIKGERTPENIEQAAQNFESNKDGVKDAYQKQLEQKRAELSVINDKLAKHLLQEKNVAEGDKAQQSLFQIKEKGDADLEDMKGVVKEFIDNGTPELDKIQKAVAKELSDIPEYKDNPEALTNLVEDAYNSLTKDKSATPEEKQITHGVIGQVGKWLSNLFGGEANKKVVILNDSESMMRKARDLGASGDGVIRFMQDTPGRLKNDEIDTTKYKAWYLRDGTQYGYADLEGKDGKRYAVRVQVNRDGTWHEISIDHLRAAREYSDYQHGQPYAGKEKQYKKEFERRKETFEQYNNESISNRGQRDILEQRGRTEPIPQDELYANKAAEPTQDIKGEVENRSLRYKLRYRLRQYLPSAEPRLFQNAKGEILGFADPSTGKIYLNGEHLNPNSPIHEAGHIFIQWAKDNATGIYDKGMKVVDGTRYLEKVKANEFYKNEALKLGKEGSKDYEDYMKHEALAMAIGDKGAQFVTEARKRTFKEWANALWDKIATTLGFKNVTAEQLQNMTFDEFTKRAARDILSGEKQQKSIPLQQIESDANDIITGKKVFERFSQNEQRGFAEGGQIHAEASIILARSEGASGEPEAQEQTIEKYAKDKGVWVSNTDVSLRSEYGKPISELDVDKNHEATVWLKDDGNTVVKSQNTAMYGFDLQQKLDGITLQNAYFPEAAVKVIGFGKDSKGDFQVIVEQPFIHRHPEEKVTEPEIDNYFQNLGFKKQPENSLYTNGDVIIEDVHLQNAIKDKDGNIIVIDPIMRLNTPEQGYGGERKVSNNISENKIEEDGTQKSSKQNQERDQQGSIGKHQGVSGGEQEPSKVKAEADETTNSNRRIGGETKEEVSGGDGTGISKKRFLNQYGKRVDFAPIKNQERVDRVADSLAKSAAQKGVSIEKEAEAQVNAMAALEENAVKDAIEGKKIEAGRVAGNLNATDHNIITAAYHLMNIEDAKDEALSKADNAKNIADKKYWEDRAIEISNDRDKTIAVLRIMSHQTGTNLQLFDGIFSKTDRGTIAIEKIKMARALGVDNIPTTMDALQKSDLNPYQKKIAEPFVKHIEAIQKNLDEAEAESKKIIATQDDKEVADKIKKAYEQGKADAKITVKEGKGDILNKKGDKTLADKIRGLKTDKGSIKLDATIGGWNLLVEAIARLVEAGSTIRKAIQVLIEKGEAKEEDRHTIENRFVSQVNKVDAIESINDIAKNEGVTGVSKTMVDKGLIDAVVDHYVRSEVPSDKVIETAMSELKEHLPDITEKQLKDAYVRRNEFKQDTKQGLDKEFAEKKAEVKRIAVKEAKLEALENGIDYHAADKAGKKEITNQHEVEVTNRIKQLEKEKRDAERAAAKEAKPEPTHADRLAKAKEAVEKKIAEIRQEIADKERKATKEELPLHEDVELTRLREVEKSLTELRDKYLLKEPEQWKDEKALKTRRQNLEKEISDLNDQINSGERNKKASSPEDTEHIKKLRAIKEAKQELLDNVAPDLEKEARQKQRKIDDEKKKVEDIQKQIDYLKDKNETFKKAVKSNPKEVSEALKNVKNELEKEYRNRGLRKERGNKNALQITQETENKIQAINEDKTLSDEDKSEQIKDLKAERDEQVAGTMQGVLNNLTDSVNNLHDELVHAANNAPETKEAAAIKNKVADLLNFLQKNQDTNVKDKLNAAHEKLGDLASGIKDEQLRNAVENIQGELVANANKTSDELSRQQLEKQFQREIKEAQRKINSGNFTRIPATPYDLRRSEALTVLNHKRQVENGKLKNLTRLAQDKNKSLADKLADARRDLIVSGVHTALKVGEASIVKTTLDPIADATFGRIWASLTGAPKTSFKSALEGWKSIAKFKNSAEADAFIEKKQALRIAALEHLNSLIENKATEAEITKAEQAFNQADLDYAGASIYRSISANSLKDFAQYMAHGATDFEQEQGKGIKRSITERKSILGKTFYVMSGIIRSHAASKGALAARSEMVRSFNSIIEDFKKQGRVLDEENIALALALSAKDFDYGKMQQATGLSKLIQKGKASEDKVTRIGTKLAFAVATAPINILKAGIDMSTFGAEGFVRLGSAAREGMRLNELEGKQYDTWLQKVKAGIRRMPIQEKKYINRVLTNGSFGATLIGLTILGAASGNIRYGGAWDDRRKVLGSDGQPLKAGEWEFFGWRAPSLLNALMNHTPHFLPMALTADAFEIRKINAEREASGKNIKEGAFGQWSNSAMNELIERMPLRTFIDLIGKKDKVGEAAKSVVNIPLATEAEGVVDTTPRITKSWDQKALKNVGLNFLNPVDRLAADTGGDYGAAGSSGSFTKEQMNTPAIQVLEKKGANLWPANYEKITIPDNSTNKHIELSKYSTDQIKEFAKNRATEFTKQMDIVSKDGVFINKFGEPHQRYKILPDGSRYEYSKVGMTLKKLDELNDEQLRKVVGSKAAVATKKAKELFEKKYPNYQPATP